ncbi:MAG TPA: PPOX class F420-dependent oxidoreductase [bacterium]|nr:PPOX class F420-dependent oxidoreductase [bacterium]
MDPQSLDPLGAARYLALTTFRRDGRDVTTPVWPVGMNGRLYVGTTRNTGKFKRLRHNDHVRFAPCNANGSRILGEWHEGRAHVVEDAALRRDYLRALRRKYTWAYYLIMLIYRLRGLYPQRVVLEIEAEGPAAAS